MNIDFPYHFDQYGHTAETTYLDHIQDMVELILFTSPGERVNRPDFGAGLLQLVFEPDDTVLATTVQTTVQGALERWLGNVIEVNDLQVISEGTALRVEVKYRVLLTNEEQSIQRSFELESET